jgi:hypothetical protein
VSRQLDPTTFAKAIILEAADIPAHMTIAQWRASKRAAKRELDRERTGRRWGRRRSRQAFAT